MSTIFISHVIGDAPLMEEIAEGLEAAGYTAWYFERDVLPGTSYLIQITQAMDFCDAIILLVTPPALASDQVTKEVVGAFERGIPLFPILVGVTPPELKESQPEWRHALGGTAMITVGPEGITRAVSRVVEGLEAKGIRPGEGRAEALTPDISAPAAPAPGRITERILAARSTMEGERKQVTVLYVSVVGLPSEELDPEEVHELIQPAMGLMAEEVHRFEGTVAQLSSDGLTALFGAPLAHEDAPQRALYAALAIRRRLQDHMEELADKGLELEIRMGVNTGLVIVGRIRDDLTMEYTAIGDTVSLAASMENSAEPGTILVAEDTYRLSEGYFDFEGAGEVEVRGRKKPVKSHRLLAALPARGRISASLAKKLSPFVGRERELEHLSGCYQQARDGRGQVVGVVGEPGVGKSRLLLQFRQTLPEGDHTYLEGECIHFGDTVAYLPILDIIRTYFDIGEGEKECATKKKLADGLAGLNGHLDRILPPLHELLSLEVEDEEYLALEPAHRREMVFEAIRHLLLSECRERPLVLTVEGLQWIDRTSEEFLSYLVDYLGSARVLLVLLYRPEYTPAWISRASYSQVSMDEFTEDTSADLIRSILSEGEVSPGLSEFIVQRSSGNPLFIEELTRDLEEAGFIEMQDGHYILSGRSSDVQVPDTVQGIIASRLDRLEEDLKEILQIASVIGREFSYRLLEAVTGQGKVLKSCLHELQSLEFIYEKSLFPETEYIFKHAFTQEVAYGSLLLKKRREMHEEIGRAIEELYPDRLEDFYETLAHHYSRSDNHENALTYLKLSGDKAAHSYYSNWEAVSFYREAIEVLDNQPDTRERNKEKIDIYISIMDPLAFLSFPDGSIDILEEAETLADKLGDEDNLTKVYSKLAFCHSFRGNTALGLEYSEKCFEAAEKAGDIDSMAVTAFDICSSMFYAGRLVDMAAITGRVLQLIEEQHREGDIMMGGTTIYSNIIGWHALVLGFLGEFEETEKAYEEGLKHTLEVGDSFGSGFVEAMYCMTSLTKGEVGRLIEHARKALEYFEETGIEIFVGQAWTYLGLGHSVMGEHEEARKHGKKGVEKNKEIGPPALTVHLESLLALIYLHAGDHEKALSSADEALQLSRDYRSKILEAYSLQILGRIEGEVDPSRIDTALQNIRQGISMFDEMESKPYVAFGHLCLGEALEIAGQSEEALESLQKAEEMYREMRVAPQSYWLTRTREALARLDR